MTYLVASLTLDSANSSVMQVVIVVVILIVVVVAIVGMVIVVVFMIIVTFPSILLGNPPMKTSMSFSIFVQVIRLACYIPIVWAYAFHQDKASSVRDIMEILEFKTSKDRYEDNRMSDSIGGGDISSGRKKSRGSNSHNTEGTTVGEAIGACSGGIEPPSNAIIPILPTIEDPEDSLIIGNEELSTISKKKSDEFIKSSVEDRIPIPTVTFSNPLFNSNDDFTSSGDESLSDEDLPKNNVKIYSNPLFKFDDEYISSDVNPLFDKVLENIESKDSYDSNLDEPDLLVTPFFNANKVECFDLGGDDDEINVFDYEDSYYDSEGDILYLDSLLNDDLVHHDLSIPAMSVASILKGFTDEPPLEENDDLFDLESKNDEWKKILYDSQINDLMSKDKVFDPGIHDQNFSPTYDRLDFKDSRSRSFVYRPLEFQSLTYGNPIS
nr:hypothetical protein [Tanacetum cinerariifolium]